MKKPILLFVLLLSFLVAGCDPTVRITSPQDGDSFEIGETITFSCSARDFEDGDLSGEAIVWTSSIDGKIGTGAEFATDSLSPGEHVITVTATDSAGGYTTHEITIMIGGDNATTTTTTTPDNATTTTVPNTVTATYYVSPDGSDSNPGTEAEPWKTIQKAADTLVAGEMVYIKTGTYAEKVTPVNSGTFGSSIIYAAYPGDTVTIDGKGILLSTDDMDSLFFISGRSYIKISGLRIINAGPNDNNAGIMVLSSDHITIEKNYTYNTVSSGIGVWDSNAVVIDGNEVELACNDGQQESISIAGSYNFDVKNNTVHDNGPGTNGGEGIDAKDGSHNGAIHNNHVYNMNNKLGIYVDSWDKHTYNIDVYANIVHDVKNADGFTVASESGGLLENIHIYNNIAYNNENNGITVSKNGDTIYKHPIKNIYIINNTFYGNGTSTWGGGISVENPDASQVVIKNNICSRNLFFQIQVEVSIQGLGIDHNLIDGFRDYDSETRGDDYVERDPLFVNAAQGNFHLQKNSPAIDKGSADSAPSFDYDNSSRPQGQGYDIGAFEYGGD